SRPFMAYWGRPQHPVKCLQLKVMKDDYDFSSALFYSVQNNGSVLGQVRFQSDGGDRHPSLDRIRDQRFQLSRMAVHLSFNVLEDNWKLFAKEVEVTAGTEPLPLGSPLFVDMGDMQIATRFLEPNFSSYEPQMRFIRKGGKAVIELILMSSPDAVTVDWRQVKSAGCGIALMMAKGVRKEMISSGAMELRQFSTVKNGKVSITNWQSPGGRLEVVTATNVAPGDLMNRAFRASIDGHAVPMIRLSNTVLVS
ncbi:MAG: hypothetical protein ACLGRW_17075, partial [Acidobacteriota bacterium]